MTQQLVTPYPQLEAFIGKEALDATLHKSIDESIVTGGGIERSIQVSQDQIQEYQNTLANADQVRAEDKQAGMSDKVRIVVPPGVMDVCASVPVTFAGKPDTESARVSAALAALDTV